MNRDRVILLIEIANLAEPIPFAKKNSNTLGLRVDNPILFHTGTLVEKELSIQDGLHIGFREYLYDQIRCSPAVYSAHFAWITNHHNVRLENPLGALRRVTLRIKQAHATVWAKYLAGLVFQVQPQLSLYLCADFIVNNGIRLPWNELAIIQLIRPRPSWLGDRHR